MKIIFIALLLTTMVACKKEKDNDGCRITRISTGGGALSYVFTYGSNGSVSSMASSTGGTYAYEYEGNTTTITATENGNFAGRYIITNNNMGLATNIRIEQNESGSQWHNQAITYEGKKIIRNTVTASSSGNDSSILNYIWEEGNPTVYLTDGDMFYYDYYKEKRWQPGEWRNIQQMIAGYKIYEYQNLVKSQEHGGIMTWYTYMYDDAGRIIEATAMKEDETIIYTIEYACK